MLCEVNEEKLARGLGATGSAFRRMLEQTAGEPDWLNICTARWNKCVRFLLAWLPVDLMEMSVLAPRGRSARDLAARVRPATRRGVAAAVVIGARRLVPAAGQRGRDRHDEAGRRRSSMLLHALLPVWPLPGLEALQNRSLRGL